MVDGTGELEDVDSQQEQTYLTQQMQSLARTDPSKHYPQQNNHSTELHDIEHLNKQGGLIQYMVNLSLSDAPDMSPCRKWSDYTPLTSHAACMWMELIV